MGLRGILGVALLVSRRGFRAWQAYLSSLFSTVWMLILFYMLGSRSFLPHVTVGAILSLTLSGSSSSAVYDAYYNLIGLRDAFLASPVSALEFRTGVALGTFLPSLPTLLAYCTLLFFIADASPLTIILATSATALLTWVVGVFLGYIVARGDLNAGPKIDLLSHLLTMLPPIYYPADILPRELRALAHLAPTYNISELAKSMLGVTLLDFTHAVACVTVLALQLALLILFALKTKD